MPITTRPIDFMGMLENLATGRVFTRRKWVSNVYTPRLWYGFDPRMPIDRREDGAMVLLWQLERDASPMLFIPAREDYEATDWQLI